MKVRLKTTHHLYFAYQWNGGSFDDIFKQIHRDYDREMPQSNQEEVARKLADRMNLGDWLITDKYGYFEIETDIGFIKKYEEWVE
jgi:hypothetical protein